LYEFIKNQKIELKDQELQTILLKLKNDKFGSSFLPDYAKEKLDVTELESKNFYNWTPVFFAHEKRAAIKSFGIRIELFSKHYYNSSIMHFKSLPKIEQVING
jgi:hypothetical protein